MEAGRTRRHALSIIAMLVCLAGAGQAFAACTLAKMVDLPVTMIDMHPVVTGQINGTAVQFVADSGAFYSMLSPASAAELKLKTYSAPFGLRVTGVGGEASISIAQVKDFTLTGLNHPIHNVEFLVGGGEAGSGGVGLLGQNVFRIGDVEYDLAKGVIRLMHEDGCAKANLAYWVTGTTPYSILDIQSTTPLAPFTTGSAVINGVKIRVLFDTGAATSFISARAAERAGIKIDAPGVTFAGYSRGIGRETVKTWIAPVASFKLGDEEIQHTRLRIGESLIDLADMLIGADFFLSHRVYVASGQRRLYFTYNGGAVFNLASLSPAPRTAPEEGAAAPPADDASAASAANPVPAEAAPGSPKDAAEFSRRGAAFAARRDFAHAIEDLNRACELAPDEPDYFYERGVAHRDSGQPDAALSDFDRALTLKPDHVPARVARAELRLAGKDAERAIEDLDAADRAAAAEADARLRMAAAYLRADRAAAAVTQLNLWIAAHREDARAPDAMSERCWVRALSGQDLAQALDDCNAAVKRSGKGDVMRATSLNGRGLVRLRLGDYGKSIADYDAVLGLHPDNAWALYGRGVAKLRSGKAPAGETDMAAATARAPRIAEAFAKHGIQP